MRFLLWVLFIAGSAFAGPTTPPGGPTCPAWMSETSSFPVCPASGGLLDETFPVVATVISDLESTRTPGAARAMAWATMWQVLTAAGDRTPLMLLPVTDETFQFLQEQISHEARTTEEKTRWLASLRKVDAQSYRWQQDYFAAVATPQGAVQLRHSDSYHSLPTQAFNSLLRAAGDCGIVRGPPLRARQGNVDGSAGGNLLTLPGGICLAGDDHFASNRDYTTFFSQLCDTRKMIHVPTHWLNVGHSDEIVKVIRVPTRASPCDFAVEVASPDKALELMRADANGSFVPSTITDNQLQSEMLLRLCFLGERLQGPSVPRPVAPVGGQSQWIWDFGLTRASAMVLDNEQLPPLDPEILRRCRTLKNGTVARAIEGDSDFRIFNRLVQKKMTQLKSDIQSALKKQFPQCAPDVFDVPQLFYGDGVLDIMNPRPGGPTQDLPGRAGLSVLPNPTNAMLVGSTLITPEPYNEAFKHYLSDEVGRRGLTATYVDSFDAAHLQGGNLHCATHEIRKCRPR